MDTITQIAIAKAYIPTDSTWTALITSEGTAYAIAAMVGQLMIAIWNTVYIMSDTGIVSDYSWSEGVRGLSGSARG